MDLTTLTPAQIDELWAPVAERVQREYFEAKEAQHRAEIARSEASRNGYFKTAAVHEARWVEAKDAQAPFVAEWDRRGGWTRAYIVSGGHVHRSTACHTLYITTRISWLPEQSGKNEAEIVELAGERACTVCYPSAPVDVLKRPTQLYTAEERRDNEARAQRAQELATKKAAAAAKAITNPDGTRLVGMESYDVIATEITARNRAVELIHDHLAYGYEWSTKRGAAWDRITTAIAHKHGVAVSDIAAELRAKAEKKAAKTKREMAAGR